mgnify:CR=1 FL=1
MVWVPHGVRRSNEDIAYCAGLFDGEGCVMYKQYSRSRNKGKTSHLVWKITLEINMIELDQLHYFYNTLRVGTITLLNLTVERLLSIAVSDSSIFLTKGEYLKSFAKPLRLSTPKL